MTKIKKTVWSKLFGFVLGFALVFSLLFANTGLVASATTSEDAQTYVGYSVGYKNEDSATLKVDSSILVNDDFRGKNVLKAIDLYNNKLTVEDKLDEQVVNAKKIFDQVWNDIFKAPHDVLNEINSKLTPMLEREGGVVYSDKTTFEQVKALFEALDENQKSYISSMKDKVSNYPTFMADYENSYEDYKAVEKRINEICAEIDRVSNLINELETNTASGVKYSQKTDFDALYESYYNLDESAREEVNSRVNEEVLETVKTALETIETRAAAAKTALENILYYVDGEMVANPEGTIVYDSKVSVENATSLLASIYDGTENVASLSYASDRDEYNVLATAGLVPSYTNYDSAVSTLAGYKAQADEVATKINAIVLSVENNYKAIESTIVAVYGEYVALNFTEYNGHHNLQNYLSSEEVSKIVNAKTTLDAINAWIAKVAMFVEPTATAETADSVIAAILERGNVDEFISLDMDTVNNLISEHTTLCGEDEIITKATEDARRVLDLIKARVETLEEEVQEVITGLEDLEELATSGIKYSDKAKYEEVKSKYDALPEGALKEAVAEQAEILNIVKTALETIETRAKAAQSAIDNILYYLNGEMVADASGEIVVASEESLKTAALAVLGIYDGTENIAEIEYEPLTRWGEVEVNALVNAGLISDLDKFDAAVNAMGVLYSEAESVEEMINAIVLSAENNYKTLETSINSAYNAYVALNRTAYNGFNNLQELIEDEDVKTKIVNAKTVLDNINAWILEVAKLVNADATAENADSIISEANALETIVVATLDSDKVTELLNKYNTLNTDDITEASMSDAYEVLNKVKVRVEELNEDVDDAKTTISNLPTTDITYADKKAYDDAKAEYDALEPIAKEKLNEEINAEEILDALKSALDQIEERANSAFDAISNIEYYLDGEMVKNSDGEIVYDSKTSIENATEALSKIYDGTNNVANLPYKWSETEINALVEAGLLTNLDLYDEAVSTLAGYKAEADAVKSLIDAIELSAENNYKTLESSINEAYDAYVALDKEGYEGHNNLQNFLDEDVKSKIVNAKETLDAINAWILDVAKLVYADATAETADSIISEANALETIVVATLDLDKVTELLNKYNTLNTDDATESSMKEAYEVLGKVKARVEELNEQVDEIVDDITEFETMATTGIKYSYKAKYETIKSKYDALDPVAKDKVNELANVETVLTTVKTALDKIVERANSAQTAISNILYLLNGEMTADANGEVVYASDVTITAAKALLNAIYDGTENIADMKYTWDDSEVVTYALHYGWDEAEIAAFNNDGLLLGLSAYNTAAAALEVLKAEAKAVADKIEALEITAANHYKVKETEIVSIYGEFVGLNRGEYNNLQNYVNVELASKINNAKATLDTINAWILKVAQLVNVDATAEDADQVIADTLASGVATMVKFNVNTINAMIQEHAETFAIDDVLTASVKDAYDVLMLIKARIEEINANLKETIEDVVNRDKDGTLKEEDYDKIKETEKTHDGLDDSQKDLLDDSLEDTTYEEFLEIANKFLFATYFKQAVAELYRQVGENYFTVEGYILGKTLFSMYNTFDATMLALVSSCKPQLDTIDEAYAQNKDNLLDYNKIQAEFDEKLENLTNSYNEKINDLNSQLTQLQKDYISADEAMKKELQAQIDALKAEINRVNSELSSQLTALEDKLSGELSRIENEYKQALENLHETVKTEFNEVLNDQIQRELASLRRVVSNDINTVKSDLQSQIDDLKKANEDLDKKLSGEISTLRMIVYIGGGVYGVLILGTIIGLISVSKKKTAAMKEGTVVGESDDDEDEE